MPAATSMCCFTFCGILALFIYQGFFPLAIASDIFRIAIMHLTFTLNLMSMISFSVKPFLKAMYTFLLFICFTNAKLTNFPKWSSLKTFYHCIAVESV